MMRTPFFIFGLPRSRTKWLSVWLSLASGDRVTHDLASEMGSADEYLSTMRRETAGTVETGAIDGWKLIRRAMPAARMVVVYRDLAEVRAELAGLGADPQEGQLEAREAAMHELSAQPGVLSVRFEHLPMPQVCELVHRQCLPFVRFDYDLWRRLDAKDVTIDFGARMARLKDRRENIEALKLDVARKIATHKPWVDVAEEDWSDCRDECEALGARHHAEASVEAGVGKMDGMFGLDHKALMELGRGLRCFTSRVNSRLAGYCLWTHERNVEAVGTSAMVQGPFYVVPELPGLGLGKRMMTEARRTFANEGIGFLRLHHTTAGRGRRAGSLYRRMGAIETKIEYTLPVGVA